MNNLFSDSANLAFTALLGLRKIGPFLGQRPALLRLARVAQAWMGIFKWSVYLFSGRIESADKSDPRRRASIDVLSACWCAVGQYDSIRETMVSTPATIEIATRCWLEEDDGPIPSHVDAPVGTCVLGNLLKHATSAQLDRVLKMTGGKADEIAKLAISHLRGALTMRPVNATRLVIYLDFINSLSRVGTHPLRYALLGANVIWYVTNALVTISILVNTTSDPVFLNAMMSGFCYLYSSRRTASRGCRRRSARGCCPRSATAAHSSTSWIRTTSRWSSASLVTSYPDTASTAASSRRWMSR